MKWWVFVVLVGVVCGAPPLKHTAKRKSVRQSQKKVHGTDIGTPVPPKRKKLPIFGDGHSNPSVSDEEKEVMSTSKHEPDASRKPDGILLVSSAGASSPVPRGKRKMYAPQKYNRVNDGGAASSAIPMFRDRQSNPSVSDREKETIKHEPDASWFPGGMWLEFADPVDLCEVMLLFKIKRFYNSLYFRNKTAGASVFVPILPSTTMILPSGEVQHSQEQKKSNMLALTPYKAAVDAYNKCKETLDIKEKLKEAPQLADESKIKTSHDEQPRTQKYGLDRMLFDVAVTPGQAFVDNGVDKMYCRLCNSVTDSKDFATHVKQDHGWCLTDVSEIAIHPRGGLTFWTGHAAITDVWVRGKQLIDAVSDNRAALCMRCGNWIRGVLDHVDILHDINYAVVLQHLETCTGVLPEGVVVVSFFTQPTLNNKISIPHCAWTADKAETQFQRIICKLKQEEKIKRILEEDFAKVMRPKLRFAKPTKPAGSLLHQDEGQNSVPSMSQRNT